MYLFHITVGVGRQDALLSVVIEESRFLLYYFPSILEFLSLSAWSRYRRLLLPSNLCGLHHVTRFGQG